MGERVLAPSPVLTAGGRPDYGVTPQMGRIGLGRRPISGVTRNCLPTVGPGVDGLLNISLAINCRSLDEKDLLNNLPTFIPMIRCPAKNPPKHVPVGASDYRGIHVTT
jgi:hypothetical protein